MIYSMAPYISVQSLYYLTHKQGRLNCFPQFGIYMQSEVLNPFSAAIQFSILFLQRLLCVEYTTIII